jgi:arsenite-transporting ATPase
MPVPPATRTPLFTGKGGVGKTTTAAATAVWAAVRGRRSLVLSTDAAHSLADAFGVPVGAEPLEVAGGVWAQQVDAQARFERSWAEIQRYLMSVLDAAGVDTIASEELAVLPGAEEVLALLEVRDQVTSGRWDLVVVDCAPTGETLRLLALPEALSWYMDRVLPVQRKVVKALRPVLSRAAGVPLPRDTVFDAFERLHGDLAEVRDLLTGPSASVRLVLTPEAVVVAEARRALTTLSLYGYRVDAVVANRVFPEAGADAWRREWVLAQAEQLTEVDASFAPLPVSRSAFRPREPIGIDELSALGLELYQELDPLAPGPQERPLTIGRRGDRVRLRLALPLADREGVDVVRHGSDLVVTVGSYRRVIALPAMLSRFVVTGARLEGGSLQVAFGLDGTASGPTMQPADGACDRAPVDSTVAATERAG